jgi:hypothetical protein
MYAGTHFEQRGEHSHIPRDEIRSRVFFTNVKVSQFCVCCPTFPDHIPHGGHKDVANVDF